MLQLLLILFQGLRVKSGEPAQCTMRWLALMYGPLLVAAIPRFDPSALLREVLIPADAAIGTVIYRLRASDPAFNYPLQFTIQDQSTAVYVDSLNCTRFNSVCQANIVLQKRLEIGRFYDFRVRVLSQRGEGASLNCSFRATNATTPIEKIFPGAPTLLMVSERSRRNTELGTVIGKGHPKKNNAVLLELWGARQFGLHQKLITDRDAEGTILLLSPLDYEIQTVHHLTILANDPWTELETDTRNIAGWPLLVAVLDEQDTPPVFTLAPPTTTLSPSLQPGDLLLRVNAEDGDRGNPRPIRYGLVPDSNPFVSFFNMSEDTGELFLSRPLSEILSISHSGQPILLKVVAEEVRSNPQEAPAQSSTVQLALIPPGVTAGSPTFGAIEYNAIISENSPTGTLLNLAQAEINTQPGDVVTLTIEKNNNTFDISPGVVEGHAKFQIRVHDPRLLDYEERHSVQCYLVAKEIGTGNFTARAKLTVLLTDLNDNPPSFVQDLYVGNVQEHSAIGTTVLRVEAYDMDREPGNKVRYVNLTGVGSGIFNLAEHTGLITVADPHNLDAEMYQSLTLKVAAADEDGQGLYAWATIKINILDVNDHEPICAMQEFIISPERNGFTSDGIVRATDADATSPNNQVQFEITDDVNNLSINKDTGQLYLTSPWTKTQVFPVKIRVYDGGIPRNSVECEVRIYPAEGMTRRMTFIVPGGNPDRAEIARTLATLTGGKVTINNIRPYDGDTDGATDISRGYEKNRSVVDATIRYAKNSVIDVDRIQQILDSEYKYKYSVKREEKIRQSSSSDLLWLLILLIILAIITAIVLILCCICKPCPFYIAPKRRKIVSADIQEKLVVKGSAQGHESKSVQVAEWFGRKEAWSPEPVMIDAEVESLRRHEVERGSDRGGKRTIHRQGQIHREASREQLYIREGNTDILRLITRGGGGDQRVLVDPVYMPDSGKDALMRRFIDQQQAEALRTQTLLPNAVNRLQTEHELLEASLRQQNALLRQIILDRERDLRLETQSLPAGTQTDQDMSTQTEPQYLRPPRRRVQSDNDVTDEGSDDDELALIKARIRQRNNRRVTKSHIKRKIKTPIQEESEIDLYEKVTSMVQASSNTVSTGTSRPKIKQTKTSEMRQKRASSESRANLTKSALRKEVLREITASLERTMTDDNQNKAYDSYTDDSLEDISPRSEKTTDSSGKVRYHSESDLRLVSNKPSRNNSDETAKTEQVAVKSQSQSDLTNVAKVEVAKPKEKKATKRGSRYMEWYDKKNSTTKSTKQPVDGKVEAAKTDDVKENNAVKEKMKTMSSTRLMKDTESSSRKKVDGRKSSVGPEHPLLQHSEHRFEAQYPMNVRRPEEDTDSGIAMTRPPMAQKKSVFTIAYNDIHTSQLRPDSTTPPL